mmetsp:Transcript_53365/g.117159  ORF Transcript_53365/g.117159 Transcript_53365/m.117159 type:complete len:615 (-) Transcript_53365:309-2153(-)
MKLTSCAVAGGVTSTLPAMLYLLGQAVVPQSYSCPGEADPAACWAREPGVVTLCRPDFPRSGACAQVDGVRKSSLGYLLPVWLGSWKEGTCQGLRFRDQGEEQDVEITALRGLVHHTLRVKTFTVGPPAVGYFLRNMTDYSAASVVVPNAPDWLNGHVMYRIAPTQFPEHFRFHYDGLSSPMRFEFGLGGKVDWTVRLYQSKAKEDMSQCAVMLQAGTGPISHLTGTNMCMTNPAVNPFPIEGQLWLTIDNAWWGRVDPVTLETIEGVVDVRSSVLSAHPACDHVTGECFTNYQCGMLPRWSRNLPPSDILYGSDVCIGKFVPGEGDMKVVEISRVTLPRRQFVHHSHAPCMSENFLVVKLDSFDLKWAVPENTGLLKFVNQKMDNLWLVMDRKTNVSRVLDSGDFKFVNNHMLNCVEEDGFIIADVSPATDKYLDNYFDFNLAEDDRRWEQIMLPGRRCYIPIDPEATSIKCEKMVAEGSNWDGLFDFPTFNPKFKGNPASRWWYGTAPENMSSLWMNTVLKGDRITRRVDQVWSVPGVYTTEANFIPRPGATEEDDGVLFSVMYDSIADDSLVVLINASTMETLGNASLGRVVPYHSHGALCDAEGRCYANP